MRRPSLEHDAGDVRAVEVERVRGQELASDDHRARREPLERFPCAVPEMLEQPPRHVGHVVRALTEHLVARIANLRGDGLGLELERVLGVDALRINAPLDAQHEAAVLEEQQMRADDLGFRHADLGQHAFPHFSDLVARRHQRATEAVQLCFDRVRWQHASLRRDRSRRVEDERVPLSVAGREPGTAQHRGPFVAHEDLRAALTP